MSTIAKNSGDFEIVAAGVYVARCIQVIDLGDQPHVHPKASHKWQAKVLLGWEIYDDDKAAMAWRRYTLSTSPKSYLGQHLVSWRGRQFTDVEMAGFQLKNILDKPCMLTVVHRSPEPGKTYANVDTVTGVPKGMTVPERVGEILFFDLDDYDQATFDKLGDKLKATIMQSRQMSEQNVGSDSHEFFDAGDGPADEPADDPDIPFIFLLPLIGGLAWLASAASSVPGLLT